MRQVVETLALEAPGFLSAAEGTRLYELAAESSRWHPASRSAATAALDPLPGRGLPRGGGTPFRGRPPPRLGGAAARRALLRPRPLRRARRRRQHARPLPRATCARPGWRTGSSRSWPSRAGSVATGRPRRWRWCSSTAATPRPTPSRTSTAGAGTSSRAATCASTTSSPTRPRRAGPGSGQAIRPTTGLWEQVDQVETLAVLRRLRPVEESAASTGPAGGGAVGPLPRGVPEPRTDRWAVLGQDGGQSIDLAARRCSCSRTRCSTRAARPATRPRRCPSRPARRRRHLPGQQRRPVERGRRCARRWPRCATTRDGEGYPARSCPRPPEEREQGIRFWPEHGICLDDWVYLYYLGIQTVDRESIWGFRTLGTGLAALRPALRRLRARDQGRDVVPLAADRRRRPLRRPGPARRRAGLRLRQRAVGAARRRAAGARRGRRA